MASCKAGLEKNLNFSFVGSHTLLARGYFLLILVDDLELANRRLAWILAYWASEL